MRRARIIRLDRTPVPRRPRPVVHSNLFYRSLELPFGIDRNGKPGKPRWRLDSIPVSPVPPRVLHIIKQDELVNAVDQIEVPLPGDVVRLDDGYSLAWHAGGKYRNRDRLQSSAALVKAGTAIVAAAAHSLGWVSVNGPLHPMVCSGFATSARGPHRPSSGPNPESPLPDANPAPHALWTHHRSSDRPRRDAGTSDPGARAVSSRDQRDRTPPRPVPERNGSRPWR